MSGRWCVSRYASLLLPALAVGALVVSAGPVDAQGPEQAAREFSEAWATGDAERLEVGFAPAVRLTLDGRTRMGVRPDQAAEALRRVLEAYRGPAPRVVRAEPTGTGGESGFAELRWDAVAVEGGTPRPHTILLTFVRMDAGWRVSELRIVI